MSNEDTTRDDSGMKEPRREHNSQLYECSDEELDERGFACMFLLVLVGSRRLFLFRFEKKDGPTRQRECVRRAELQRGARARGVRLWRTTAAA